jgi:serine phosphatase RsbU (regulator of sigma subunit)
VILSALLIASLAAAAWGYGAGRSATAAGIRAALWRLGALVIAWKLLLELSRLAGPGATLDALFAARAAVSLFMWAHVAYLAAIGPRPGKVRIVFAVLALLAAAGHAPFQLVGLLTLCAAWSYRWLEPLGTRTRLTVAIGALVVLAMEALHFRNAPQPVAAGAMLEPWIYAKWGKLVTLGYMAIGFTRALGAFVTDPTLGIRTVRRRLALSHALVLLVPLGITLGLWLLTTWLGVGADRAVQARRVVAAEAQGMRPGLDQALRTPGDPAAALAAYAQSRRAERPHLRVWLVREGALTRVAGDSTRSERALAAWCESLGPLPAAGVVELEGFRFLGATVRDSVRGIGAVAMVPILEVLEGEPSRVVDARLWMKPEVARVPMIAGDDEADSTDSPPDADSAAIRRVRGVTRGLGIPDSAVAVRGSRANGVLSITTASDTVDMNGEDFVADSTGMNGQAVLKGIRWTGTRWSAASFRLRSQVTFAGTLSGMYRNVSENPLNAIPIAILVGLVLLLIPVALFNFTLVRQLGRSFMGPVAALREGTRALAESKHDYRIAVRGDDELWDAAGAFNTMAEGLERARELEKERDRIEHELDLARRIQRRLLPAAPPAVPGTEIAGRSEAALEVGGDYYDHIPLADGRVLLVIADVSGKGVPAALLMSAFRASLMSQDTLHADPAEVASRLNAFLHRSVEPGKFVTAFVGCLDPASARFEYANAGHNPVVLLRRDGTVEWLAAGGLILGILPESSYERGEVSLGSGDLLALYTDGVTEGADASKEQFGEERLVATLQRLAGEPCATIAESLVREVRAFEGAQGPADDITVLVARRV